jgi:hypothetical protein
MRQIVPAVFARRVPAADLEKRGSRRDDHALRVGYLLIGLPLALRELEVESDEIRHLVLQPWGRVFALAALCVAPCRLGVARRSHERAGLSA